MTGGCVGAVNHQRLSPADAQVEGDGGQTAEATGKDGDRQQALSFTRHPAHEPR
jgi:hypothetical protein